MPAIRGEVNRIAVDTFIAEKQLLIGGTTSWNTNMVSILVLDKTTPTRHIRLYGVHIIHVSRESRAM